VRKTLIDYNIQRIRKEAEVENENKKLSSTLEVEKERLLVDRAEKEKVLEANKKLIADCERTDARYASASATASKNSQTVGKLERKVESQQLQLQIAKYKSCEVVNGDGVGQPSATQAEVTSLIAQVERLGAEMLKKSDLTEITQELCNEVCEKQKEETSRVHAEFLAILAQENAAMAKRVDSLTGMVSEIGTCIPQLMGPQGPREARAEPAAEVLKFTPGGLRLKFVSAAEQAHADEACGLVDFCRRKRRGMLRRTRLMQLFAAGEAKRGFYDAHRAFSDWKGFVLQSVLEDKKAFARAGKVPSRYRYSADLDKAELVAKMVEWLEHCDTNADVDADNHPGLWHNPGANHLH
jgi:hypothetical protein